MPESDPGPEIIHHLQQEKPLKKWIGKPFSVKEYRKIEHTMKNLEYPFF
jgi:hypothetical protein